MTIEIPAWLIWALLNLAALCGVILLFRKKHRSACAEWRDKNQQLASECAYLDTQLASLATLWLVGRHVRGNHWDVQGIFASRAEAIAACKNVRYFIFPLDLGVSLPEESTTPFKLEYPKEAE